jgi:hypothetical protein
MMHITIDTAMAAEQEWTLVKTVSGRHPVGSYRVRSYSAHGLGDVVVPENEVVEFWMWAKTVAELKDNLIKTSNQLYDTWKERKAFVIKLIKKA